jgi:thymus-specific serine protease
MKWILLAISVVGFVRVKSFGQMREEIALEEGESFTSPEIPFLEFDQKVDHFDPLSVDTYKQTYFVDDRHYKEGGPIFLQITGEWSLSTTGIENGLENALALRHGGIHIGLEHRFYGPDYSNRSLPTIDYSKESLKFLTADQALADTANFIRTVEIEANGALVDTKNAKWIVIGASYAANLAAWMRLKYPDIVFAAHSSSGPFFAKADFWECSYAVDVGIPKLGGSQTCSDNWVRVVKYFDDLVESRGAEFVLDAFGVKKKLDIRDLSGFSATFAGHVQYGRSAANIVIGNDTVNAVTAICSGKYFPSFIDPSAEPSELFKDLISFFKLQNPTPELILENFDYTEFAKLYPEVSPWYWQICKDYGYWQTGRSNVRSFYSRLMTVDYFENVCSMIYGKENSKSNPLAVNLKYLGNDFRFFTSRVVIVNGDLDPWYYLSVMDEDTPLSPNKIIKIANGTHCSDLFVPRPASTQTRKNAYVEIMNTWDAYLDYKGEPIKAP